MKIIVLDGEGMLGTQDVPDLAGTLLEHRLHGERFLRATGRVIPTKEVAESVEAWSPLKPQGWRLQVV